MKFAPLFVSAFVAACSSHPGPVVPETKVEKQMVALLEKFDRYDLDGNGQLDAKELDQNTTGHPSREILGFYDTDKSGTISLRDGSDRSAGSCIGLGSLGMGSSVRSRGVGSAVGPAQAVASPVGVSVSA